jgi:signal transduction histidine kinase
MNFNIPDIFASVVHDIKNRLFNIEMRLNETPIDVDSLGKEINESALRLDQMLTAYRLARHEQHAGLLTPTNVNIRELIEDALCQIAPLDSRLSVETDIRIDDDWICSRDLVRDMIVNGLQNAARFALSRLCISASIDKGWLTIRIDDDGPGFVFPENGDQASIYGVGLFVADKIMRLHQRHHHCGKLVLGASTLGGARFELVFPE